MADEVKSEEIEKLHNELSKSKGQQLTRSSLEELVEKAQKGISRRLFSEENIKETQKQLQDLGDAVAKANGCTVKYGPVKTKPRAEEKVKADYGGDWYEIKDVVRMTIIAPDTAKLQKVAEAIRKACKPSEGRGLLKDFECKAEKSPCGYSGLNFVALLPNGRPGEIQVNVPEIMFGQMVEKTFEEIVGSQVAAEMKKEYGIEGGLGHIFYELYRVKPDAPESKEAAAMSKEYFAFLRKANPKKTEQEAMQAKLNAFKEKFKKAIAALKH